MEKISTASKAMNNSGPNNPDDGLNVSNLQYASAVITDSPGGVANTGMVSITLISHSTNKRCTAKLSGLLEAGGTNFLSQLALGEQEELHVDERGRIAGNLAPSSNYTLEMEVSGNIPGNVVIGASTNHGTMFGTCSGYGKAELKLKFITAAL